MRIVLMGVKGGPAIRPGSNSPTSILVEVGGKTILIDAGLGVTRSLCDHGVALTDIDLILVTHLHSDHYLELGPLMHTAWTAGLNRPVPLVGPEGLCAYWNGFLQSMDFDISLRIEDEGRCALGPLLALAKIAPGIIHDEGGIRITAMRNVHPPIEESYALRIDADGKSVVFSGDTAPMDEMADFAKGADLLVHEAMLEAGVDALCRKMTNGDERLRAHIMRSHTSAADCGRIAAKAGVKALALNHFVPDSDPDFPPRMWESDVRRHFDGVLHLGRDGVTITL